MSTPNLNTRSRSTPLTLRATLMLATAVAACGGDGDEDPTAGSTPAPSPTPSPSPSPSPVPSPGPAPANPDLSTCPNFAPGFTEDRAYLQCIVGTYTGITASGAVCTLTFGGPGKGFRYVTDGIDFSAPDAAFSASIYGKPSSPQGQPEAIVTYRIVANVSPMNYRLDFSLLFGPIHTKTITVKQGNQGLTSSCRIQV